MSHLKYKKKIAKFAETENKMAVATGRHGGNGEMLVKEYKGHAHLFIR